MARTTAYNEFRGSLQLAVELIRIDTHIFRDPPRPTERQAAAGVRGGAAVLMVAAFEGYIHEFVEEFIERLRLHTPAVVLSRLPDKLRVVNSFGTLERSLKGPRFGPQPTKLLRLPNVRSASALVSQDVLNPAAFSDGAGNPSAVTVKQVMSNLGINDVFALSRARFQRKWGNPVTNRFVKDKLDEIVSRRHKVAHRAEALTLSRKDLRDAIRFLGILAEVIDIEGLRHLRTIARIAS